MSEGGLRLGALVCFYGKWPYGWKFAAPSVLPHCFDARHASLQFIVRFVCLMDRPTNVLLAYCTCRSTIDHKNDLFEIISENLVKHLLAQSITNFTQGKARKINDNLSFWYKQHKHKYIKREQELQKNSILKVNLFLFISRDFGNMNLCLILLF